MSSKRVALFFVLLFCVGSGFAQTTLSNGAKISNGLKIIQSGALCSIPPQVLPTGTTGVFYDATVVTANCPGPQIWSVTLGAIPSWATLNTSTGEISGTPTFAGTATFTMQVLDGQGNSAIYPAGLSITASANGAPALPELALLNWNTSRASTPASGPFVCVGTLVNVSALAGGCSATFTTAQFQTALNSLVCGNILVIQNTFNFPAFTIPDTACTDSNWIIVEHDITDGTYPVEGQRIDPYYAGISQSVMPYYPYPPVDAGLTASGRHMPQINAIARNNVPPISIKVPTSGSGIHGPSHWRFIGLELTRDQSTDIMTVSGIDLSYAPGQQSASPPPGQDCDVTNKNANGDPTKTSLPINAAGCMNVQPDHLIFEQMIIHGDAQRQDTRAINFGGARFVAILDSYGYDIKLTAAGGGGDAQFYFGGGGHAFTNVGDWMIKNTFSSASTMGSIFCGAYTEPISPVTGFDGVPHDVWWWQDWLWKNPLWNTQNGQTMQKFIIIEGQTYPQANDQELFLNPSSVTLNVGQSYQINEYWGNDSFGGFNRMGPTTQGIGGGVITVDGITKGNSTTGLIVRTAEVAVGSTPWQSQNNYLTTYVVCSGVGVPNAACTGATAIGTHTITFTAQAVDSRLPFLGNNRSLVASSTVTVVASGAPNTIALAPSIPDLQIQPSYSDANGNLRQFAYTMFAFPTFTSVSLTWKVDGIVNGNPAVGQICSATVIACTAPGANDSAVIYVSGTATGNHSLTVTSASNVVSNVSVINVNTSAPMLGYDFKPYTSKNGWECKCGNRVLLEDSLIENGWGSQGNGGGQQGTPMLIQTVDQATQVLDGSGVNVGYGPGVNNDFTLRYNTWRNFGGGFVVVPLSVAKGTHRVAITNSVCDNCSVKNWSNGFVKLIAEMQVGGAGNTHYGPNGVGGGGPPPWTSAINPIANDINFSHDSFFGDFNETFSITNRITDSVAVTNVDVTSNVLTVTTAKSDAWIGANVTFTGLTTATYLNNQTAAVTSVTQVNTTTTQFTFNFTHANDASHTDTGTAAWPVQWPIRNYTFQDSFFASAGTTTFANANGEPGDCNTGNTEAKAMANCLFPYVFDHVNLTDSTAPTSNFIITPTKPIWQFNAGSVLFVNYFGVNGPADYRLCKGANNPTSACALASPFAAGQPNQASDGKDLGADVDTLQTLELNVKNGLSTPMVITTNSVPDGTVGSAYSFGLGVSGGVGPYTWTVPSGVIPPGSIDLLDYLLMPLSARNSFHMSGGTLKYFKLDAGMFWWLKGANGNPWDGWWYDNNFFYFAFTEDGDPADQAACHTAGYTSCFVDPFAYKLDLSVKKFAPRYFVPNTTVTLLSPPSLTAGNVNPYQRTTNCGVDNQATLYLGNVKTVTSGPTTIAWGGSVGTVPTIEIDYFYSGNVSGVYGSRERYWLAKGFGQIQWDVASRQADGSYLVGQTSNTFTKTAGGAPTPNFACGVPAPPFAITGNLPVRASVTSGPKTLSLVDSTGQIVGIPTVAGTSTFTAQVEDSQGHVAQQTLSLTVH